MGSQSDTYFWSDTYQASLPKNTQFFFNSEKFSLENVFHYGDSFFKDSEKSICLILFQRNPESIAAYFGCLRNGVVPLLVNGDSTWSLIQNYLDAYSPKYLFGNFKNTPCDYQVIDSWREGILFRSISEKDYEIFQKLALLQPTSGTTGEPKCVRTSYKNIDFITRKISEYFNLNSERTQISSLPFNYTFGLSILNASVQTGGDLVLNSNSVMNIEFWQDFIKYKVTDLAGVPFQFQALENRGLPSAAFNSLKCVSQAGGALTEAEARWWCEYLDNKQVQFFVMYGQTEASPRISYFETNRHKDKIGSVGKPIDGGKIEIVNANEAGIGEITYYGKNVCLGYAESSMDLINKDEFNGKLETGDLGFKTRDGFIYIHGRKKRFLKLAGKTIHLDFLENNLKVKSSANVIALGSDKKLLIFVEGNIPENFNEVVFENLDLSKNLIEIQSLKEFPRLMSGKIDYNKLQNKLI